MDIKYEEELLVILIENVARILNVGFGVNHAEPSLFQIISLLKEEDGLKEEFLEMVRFTFKANDPGNCESGMVPTELVELAAHELRWSEFKQIADDRVANRFNSDRSLAVGDICMRIDEAFNDDWEDREFYARYQY